jgi:hypothetical protein
MKGKVKWIASEKHPVLSETGTITVIDNKFIDNYKFTKYNVSPIYNGLSDQTVNHHTYSIRNK